jgi:hypothetical protein
MPFYVLPAILGADYEIEGHVDYLVFEYKNQLYLLTLMAEE